MDSVNLTPPTPETADASIPKIATGVRGLDRILEGGLPRGRTILLSGGPGTGKTALAMEVLYRGALAGEPGVFVSFEERIEDLRANAAAMGMDIAGCERDGTFRCVHAEIPHRAVRAGAFDIQGLLAILKGHVDALGAKRIAIDAVDVLMRIFGDPEREREELHVLHDWLRDRGLTALITAKAETDRNPKYPFLDFMADCVLFLDQRIVGQVRTRRLNVVKYRGSAFLSNEQPYLITPRGIVLIPVSSMTLQRPVSGERVSSGNRRLDALLGGGFARGSSVLVTGTSGTGKTTVACTFAFEVQRRAEKVLFVGYEESEDALCANMRSVGLDLSSAIEGGGLRIMTALPEAAGAEQHLLNILDALDAFAPDHLVLDAVSACERMGSERAAFDFLVRLIATCRARGILCLATNQNLEKETIGAISGAGISSLVDTLVALHYADDGRALSRRLMVVKSRGSSHSHAYHPFRIGEHGLELEAESAGSAAP